MQSSSAVDKALAALDGSFRLFSMQKARDQTTSLFIPPASCLRTSRVMVCRRRPSSKAKPLVRQYESKANPFCAAPARTEQLGKTTLRDLATLGEGHGIANSVPNAYRSTGEIRIPITESEGRIKIPDHSPRVDGFSVAGLHTLLPVIIGRLRHTLELRLSRFKSEA